MTKDNTESPAPKPCPEPADQSDPIHFQPITEDEWYDRMAQLDQDDLDRMLDDMYEREEARAAAEREGAADAYAADAAL
jgi:hypothetical protein